jgi:hypothetical protein
LANGDGIVDDHTKQDIDDLRESGTRLCGDETENRTRATRKVTMTIEAVSMTADQFHELTDTGWTRCKVEEDAKATDGEAETKAKVEEDSKAADGKAANKTMTKAKEEEDAKAGDKKEGIGDTGNAYLLADPRLVKAPDDGTIVHPTEQDWRGTGQQEEGGHRRRLPPGSHKAKTKGNGGDLQQAKKGTDQAKNGTKDNTKSKSKTETEGSHKAKTKGNGGDLHQAKHKARNEDSDESKGIGNDHSVYKNIRLDYFNLKNIRLDYPVYKNGIGDFHQAKTKATDGDYKGTGDGLHQAENKARTRIYQDGIGDCHRYQDGIGDFHQAKTKACSVKDIRLVCSTCKNIRLDYSVFKDIRLGCSVFKDIRLGCSFFKNIRTNYSVFKDTRLGSSVFRSIRLDYSVYRNIRLDYTGVKDIRLDYSVVGQAVIMNGTNKHLFGGLKDKTLLTDFVGKNKKYQDGIGDFRGTGNNLQQDVNKGGTKVVKKPGRGQGGR